MDTEDPRVSVVLAVRDTGAGINSYISTVSRGRNGIFQSGPSIVLHRLHGIPYMQVDISTSKFPKWTFPFLSLGVVCPRRTRVIGGQRVPVGPHDYPTGNGRVRGWCWE